MAEWEYRKIDLNDLPPGRRTSTCSPTLARKVES
jgi:hypothetical protein